MTTTKWSIDPAHSEIGFKVKHMMFTNVSGNFGKFDASIETQGDDFETAQFPKINFKSTSFKKLNEGEYKLTGDLTLHGETKSVTLDVEFGGLAKDPWGNTKTGLSVSGKINRKDWGLNWNSALETGGVLVGEEVKLQIELQFIKQ